MLVLLILSVISILTWILFFFNYNYRVDPEKSISDNKILIYLYDIFKHNKIMLFLMDKIHPIIYCLIIGILFYPIMYILISKII